MRNIRFINGLKNGGIAIAIIYFLLNISLSFIGYILSGENIVKSIISGTSESIPLNSFNGASGRLIIYIYDFYNSNIVYILLECMAHLTI